MTLLREERTMSPGGAGAPSAARARPLAARLPVLAGWLTAGIALIAISGWILGVGWLRGFSSALPPMKVNTAVGLLCAASALVLSRTPWAFAPARAWARAFAAAAAAIGALTLIECVAGINLGIDELLLREPSGLPGTIAPGQSSPEAALCLVFLGAALLLLDRDLPNGFCPSGALAIGACAIAGVAAMGYLYDTEEFTQLGRTNRIGVNAIGAIFLLGAGVIAARPDRGLAARALSEGPGGALFRRSFLAVLAPLALGWFRLLGERSGWFDAQLGTSLVMLILMALVALGVCLQSSSLDREHSERERARSARELGAYNRSLIEASLDPLVTIDPDGKIADINAATENVTGWSRDVLIGADFSDFFTQPALARAGYQKAFKEGSVRDYPLEIRHKEGSITAVLYNAAVYRDEAGRVAGVFAAARDISERLRAQEELRMNVRALRTLTSVNEALVRAQDEGQLLRNICAVIVEQGGYLLSWVGFKRDDPGKSVEAAAWAGLDDGYLRAAKITWGDDERGRGPTGTAIREGKTVVCRDIESDPRMAPWRAEALRRGFRASATLPLSDQETTFGALMIYSPAPQAFSDEEMSLLSEMASDLAYGLVSLRARAARERAEQEVLRLNAELDSRVKRRTAQLEAANKELEAFAYSVSHDLRAPLRAVDGFSQILVEDHGPKLDAECRRLLGVVRQGAVQMGILIDDLLSFSRMSRQALAQVPADMRRIVGEALAALAGQRGGRRLRLEVGELPACEGDAALLKQVWINLIGNALKFTRTREEARIQIGADDGPEPVYWIKDNGVGFEMRYADKLFKVFQRLHTTQEFEGTGIGLAIVARIIERHGGRIWAESEPERGAKFSFTLGGTGL